MSATVWRRVRVFLSVALPIVLLDLASKHVIFRGMGAIVQGEPVGTPGRRAAIIDGILEIECVLNRGAFSGWFAGMPWLLVAISIGALIVIGALVLRARSIGAVPLVACSLIWAGTAGNLHDRILFGGVRDFVRVTIPRVFEPWPNFNVADSAICIGVVLLLLHEFLAKKERADAPSLA
ncbi:MAG: signal peptidase II [Planctomycetes bacterium]|nr:signal peptidase II [Planctomycetota bacterium]